MIFYRFKTILLGAAAVGKTSLLHRFVKDKFSETYASTIGVDFLTKEITLHEDIANITIWDLAGQEKFKFLRTNFYGGANGALLIFDLTRKETFEEINTWYLEMKEFVKKDVPFILIGNKVDLLEDIGRVIDKDEVIKFAEDRNSLYIETSAKTGENVGEAFIKLTRFMIERYEEK